MTVVTRLWAFCCGFWVVFVVLVIFSTIRLFSLPSTMTWAPCPHGVRTRGKKNFPIIACHYSFKANPGGQAQGQQFDHGEELHQGV